MQSPHSSEISSFSEPNVFYRIVFSYTLILFSSISIKTECYKATGEMISFYILTFNDIEDCTLYCKLLCNFYVNLDLYIITN